MLTLTKTGQSRPLIEVVKKQKLIHDVYWHPRRDETFRNEVEDLNSFNTPYLRDRFELSKAQADSIFDHLKRDETDVSNQKAFFKVKKYIQDALFTEMDLGDTGYTFRVTFDKDATKYSGHELIIGGTGSGKTTYFVNRTLQNLKGPKTRRRKFMIFSAEWTADRTLAPLKAERFINYVEGVDCGEAAFRESNWDTEEDFFHNEINLRVRGAEPGTVILFDDAREIVAPNLVRKLIDKTLRVGRHQGLTLMVVLHNLRSGAWSSQAYSSVRYLTTFPRSQKAKIVNFLNRDIGLPLSQARDCVYAFGQAGRLMMVRFHAPEALIGENLLRLL